MKFQKVKVSIVRAAAACEKAWAFVLYGGKLYKVTLDGDHYAFQHVHHCPQTVRPSRPEHCRKHYHLIEDNATACVQEATGGEPFESVEGFSLDPEVQQAILKAFVEQLEEKEQHKQAQQSQAQTRQSQARQSQAQHSQAQARQ